MGIAENDVAAIPQPPEQTADDRPSVTATVRLLATPVILCTAAVVCYVQGWLIAGIVLTILTLACIAVEVAIGALFIKFSLRDHANMFKTLAPLLSNGPASKPRMAVERAKTEEDEVHERAVDEAVGFGLTRLAAAGGIGSADLDDEELATLRSNVLAERELTYAWLVETGEFVDVSIVAEDGVRLEGRALACNPTSGSWVVLCHGYAGTWGSMLQYARHFAQAGYNLLIPHMRAHGNSGGRYIGMGVLDRRDVVAWCAWLASGQGPAPCTDIVLFGHSMGGASVCLAAGEKDLAHAVRAVIADCAFDTSWHAISNKLKGAGLPVHPTVDLVRLNLMARRGGYDLAAGDVAGALARTSLPVLVAHGLKDSMVPAYMARVLYESVEGEKRLLAVPGAAHCQSSLADPARYWDTVLSFLETAR